MAKKKEVKREFAIIFIFLALIFVFSFFLLIKPQIVSLVVYETSRGIYNFSFENPQHYFYNSNLINLSNGEVKIIIYKDFNNLTLTNFSSGTFSNIVADNGLLLGKALINNLTVSNINPESYEAEFLEIDDRYYIDRGHKIDSINNSLQNLLWIKTANDNKDTENLNFNFNVNYNTGVFVGIDKRADSMPAWIDDSWAYWGVGIETKDKPATPFYIYYKDFSAGDIALGDNNAKGANSMYIVLLNTTGYYYNGNFISQIYDFINYTNYENIYWESDEPEGTSIKFQIRTAATEDGLSSAEWYGPAGTDDYYTASKNIINFVHDGDRYIQYKAYLESNGANTPFLSKVKISSSIDNYYSSAEIETDDLEVTNLLSFDMFSKNALLNNQNIIYQYSLDSGDSWNTVPENNNLSDANTTNGKIRIKAILSSDGIDTPILYDMTISYFTQTIICSENWTAVYGNCLVNDAKLKTYIDSNNCGTNDNFPADNGSYVSCDYCSPNWSCIIYSECQLNNVKKCIKVEDDKSCYNLTNLSSDTYAGDYNEFNLSCAYNKTGSGFSNLSISLTANEKLIINETASTDTIVELNVSNDIKNNFISIIKYSENKKNTSPSLSALDKYLDIEADNSLKNSINSVRIKIYYTDEEINNANLEEETLKIYYYNETSNAWQGLNSIVNTTENYVSVEIEHLSTYGLFGEQKSSESSSSSSGGHSSTRIIKKTPEEETQTLVEEVKKEEKIFLEEEIVCNYDLDISLPDEISFLKKDFIKGQIKNQGNCNISEVKINASPNLIGIIDVPVFIIENLEKNEVIEFILNKKSIENRTNLLIQSFNVFRAKEIKNYKGDLLINIIEDDNIKKEIKKSINVEVLGREDIKNTIPLFFMVFIIVFIILFIIAKKTKIIK